MLTQSHWDVIEYPRDDNLSRNKEEPNNHAATGHAGELPGRETDKKTLFKLFPDNPFKRAGKIAGLLENMRNGADIQGAF